MIDANGGGSFADTDGRAGFSVPSSHQSARQTTSQTDTQPQMGQVDTSTGSRGSATVQIRKRSYVSSLWQGVLERPGAKAQAESQSEVDRVASPRVIPSPVAQPDFLPTIPQYADDSVPAVKARRQSSRPSQPLSSSAQPAQAKSATSSGQTDGAVLAKVLASTPASWTTVGQGRQAFSAPVARPAQTKPGLDRQAIMRQAAIVRQQAKERAEAQARQLIANRQPDKYAEYVLRSAGDGSAQAGQPSAGNQPASANPAQVMAANVGSAKVSSPANVDNRVDRAGAVAMPQPGNAFSRLAGAKVTLSFNLNKKRFFNFLRYATVALIIVASGYLAWDTYTTNRSVKSSLGSNSATAMSIAGTNPATAEQTAVSQEQRAAYTVPADQPRYIYIPSLGVNARVMSVGVNSRGSIDTPSNLNDTAWYDGSAKPGQEGQVFIDGHTSFNRHLNAAFNNLPKLKENDQVVIEKGSGEKISYRVVAAKTVETSKVDMGEALNPPAGAKKGLTLMTCTGTFNYRNQTADKRFIVYAVQE